MSSAIDQIVPTLSTALGPRLKAVYQFHHLPGASNTGAATASFLAVVTPDYDLHALRAATSDLWLNPALPAFQRPHLVTTTDLARYFQVHPAYGQQVAAGTQCFGTVDLRPDLDAIDNQDVVAHLAALALDLSSAIAPQLLEPEVAAAKDAQLRHAVQQLRQNEIAAGETAVNLIATLQHHVQRTINQNPAIERWQAPRRPTTSLLLPSLYATYLRLGQMVLVHEHLTPHQIASTDWDTIADRMGEEVKGLQLTTATQLRLLLRHEQPLAYTLRNYNHDWGFHLLELMEIEPWRVMRDAARKPATIAIEQLPAAYLAATEDELGMLVHDFQNKLLNIQLEHELLRRLLQIDNFTPPQPLPGRDQPVGERIDAIFQHLAWWSDFYTQQMNARRQ